MFAQQKLGAIVVPPMLPTAPRPALSCPTDHIFTAISDKDCCNCGAAIVQLGSCALGPREKGSDAARLPCSFWSNQVLTCYDKREKRFARRTAIQDRHVIVVGFSFLLWIIIPEFSNGVIYLGHATETIIFFFPLSLFPFYYSFTSSTRCECKQHLERSIYGKKTRT